MNAYDVIFDNISSSIHDLMIVNFEGEESKENKVAEHEYNTYKLKSGDIKILSVEKKGTREFNITLARKTPIELYEIDKIYKWLMPEDIKFRKLYINDPLYQGYYYDCKISNIVEVPIGGYSYAIKCTVLCQSQYAYSSIKKQIYNSPTLPLTFTIINDSSKRLTPIFKFKCSTANGNINLKNNSTNETMTLTGMNLNETITIDYSECQIHSDKNALVLSKFNKKFLNFKQGVNSLTLSGDVGNFEYSFQNAKVFVH